MPQEETTFHHRGVYEGHLGRLEMAFAVEELPALKSERARRPLHLATVEMNNALDFDAILDGAAEMELEQEAWGGDRDPMGTIVGTILDAVMAGDGGADDPDAGGFACSWAEDGWADDGGYIEIRRAPLTVRLMPGGAVKVSAGDQEGAHETAPAKGDAT